MMEFCCCICVPELGCTGYEKRKVPSSRLDSSTWRPSSELEKDEEDVIGSSLAYCT